jgi:hypothetical protein
VYISKFLLENVLQFDCDLISQTVYPSNDMQHILPYSTLFDGNLSCCPQFQTKFVWYWNVKRGGIAG